MSCAKAKSIVRAEGAVILNFRATYANVPRYGRFCHQRLLLRSSERAEIIYIPTADTKSCPVLECKLFDIDEDFDIWCAAERPDDAPPARYRVLNAP